MSDKPRIKPYGNVDCIRFICTGYKKGLHHVRFGRSMRDAYLAWEGAEPVEFPEFDTDCPF